VKTPDLDDLRKHLLYDKDTGLFAWRIPTNHRIKTGANAGRYRTDGRGTYQYIRFRGQLYLGHRLAWFYVFGKWPKTIDHINGDKRDNRMSNLRNATISENLQNQSVNGKGKSGLIGVMWDKRRRRWYGQIVVNRKAIYLGTFDDKNAAHSAYVEAKKTYHQFQPTLTH
jgi:HNH endonuclease/AP2 domain